MHRFAKFTATAFVMMAATAYSGQPALAAEACDVTNHDSEPAQKYFEMERWRYESDAATWAAYDALVKGKSPWPNWFVSGANAGGQGYTLLQPGTRFQMALSSGQKNDTPGGWGTFDYIRSVKDVREYLAVLPEFKKDVDRVVTYEVTYKMPVMKGPVGPQVDKETCSILPGRWSQFNMLMRFDNRMAYLKVVDERKIK